MGVSRFFRYIFVSCLAFGAMLVASADVGYEAPDFTARDINGQEIKLSAYRGKIVVLEWTNPRCIYVRKQYSKDTGDGVGTMQAIQKHYTQPSVGVTWFLVASSSIDAPGYLQAEEWKSQLLTWGARPTSVILDESKDLADLFGARITPEMFIIGKDGVVLYHGAVDSLRGTDPNEIDRADNLHWFRNALERAVQDKRVVPNETIPYGCPIR